MNIDAQYLHYCIRIVVFGYLFALTYSQSIIFPTWTLTEGTNSDLQETESIPV